MKGKWGLAVLISAILLAVTTIYTYISTVTELPGMGFGLSVSRGMLMGILIALGVILGIVFFKMEKGKK